MADKGLITKSTLTDIGNAIRAKNGLTTTYKPSEMAAAIIALSTGSGTSSGGVNSLVGFSYWTASKTAKIVTLAESDFADYDNYSAIENLISDDADPIVLVYTGTTTTKAITQVIQMEAASMNGIGCEVHLVVNSTIASNFDSQSKHFTLHTFS